jgi:hypothetical protein
MRGPSGSGKSSVAGDLFGEAVVGAYGWPSDRSVVDGFPAGMGVKEITALLSSVRFSSPPAWLRPFGCLSTSEQFRATLARALGDDRRLTVFDEFTSVVDRTVAQVGSAAVAKARPTAGSQDDRGDLPLRRRGLARPGLVLEISRGREPKLAGSRFRSARRTARDRRSTSAPRQQVAPGGPKGAPGWTVRVSRPPRSPGTPSPADRAGQMRSGGS